MHSDYPLAPAKLKIVKIIPNILSNYGRAVAKKRSKKIGGVNKLVPNLRKKYKYVVHCRNLQLYLSLGMKLVRIHRV